jgi:hypothetical protein
MLVQFFPTALDMNVSLTSLRRVWHSSYLTDPLAVGTVAEIGEGVKGFAVGDRVGFMPASSTCRMWSPSSHRDVAHAEINITEECSDCLAGQHRFCSRRTNVGFNGLQGGLSEYCVADPLSTVKIPEGLSDERLVVILSYVQDRETGNRGADSTLVPHLCCVPASQHIPH